MSLSTGTHAAYRKGALLVVLCGILWSTAGIGVRLLEEANGWQIVFFRSLALALVLSIFIGLKHGRRSLAAIRDCGHLGLLAGFLLGSAFFGNIFALLYTSVANVTFLLSTSPFLAALLGWFFLRERIKNKTWLAIFCTTLGVLIMVSGALSGKGILGMGFAFFMAFCYASFTVIMRRGRNLDMLPSVLIAALYSMAVSGWMIDDFRLPMMDLIICLSLGAFQIGVSLVLFIHASKHVPATEMTILTMLEVILSPLWVWLFLQENPGSWTLLGGGVILMGVLIQALGSGRVHRWESA